MVERTRRPRLLGLVIANGFSPESRVFANLLSQRGEHYEALVLHHDPPRPPPQDEGAVDAFERLATLRTERYDLGWRRNMGGRTKLAKAASFAWLHTQLPRLLTAARHFRPDVVYSSQQFWDCYAATALARLLRRPQLIHLHYNVGPWLGELPLERLRAASGVVCVSEFIRRQALLHGVAADRASVVPNTLETEAPPTSAPREALRERLGAGDGRPLFAFVARLAPEKGHADTLRAFAGVIAKKPECRMVIAGDGPLRGGLTALASDLGLGDSVAFLGHRSDVPDILGAADVFVHPSSNEPFGLAILEASRQKLPTVAYRGSGPEEIVLDGEGGILVDHGDVAGLTEAMLRLAADPGLAARMGEVARRDLVERFHPRQHGERFARFVEAAARRPR